MVLFTKSKKSHFLVAPFGLSAHTFLSCPIYSIIEIEMRWYTYNMLFVAQMDPVPSGV